MRLIKPQRKLFVPTRRAFLVGAASLLAAPAIVKAGWLPLVKSGSGPDPFALDGSPIPGNSSAANLALSGFSTTHSNTVVVIAIVTNGTAITTIGGTHGLTFARQPGLTPPIGGGSQVDIWYAVSSSPISGSATFIPNNSAAFTTLLLFALSGAKTSAPFDTNVLIPSTTATGGGAGATITTTASSVFAFGIRVFNNATNIGSGYTNMDATATSNFLELNYRFTSAGPLAGDQFDVGTSNPAVGSAIVQGP